MTARTLMIQGTSSGAGKSWLTAGLCRVYARRGLVVRPFKAQNMSNNAAVTRSGGEIGRAQWLQAVAARAEPDVRMNPILLKPLADTRSEVIVLGSRDAEITELPWLERRDRLWPVVREALATLRAECDLVVIEGAGSPAEINLPDLVNMRVAEEAEAPVVLVSDIDRGGAFAHLYGTWALLPEADRGRIAGFVLNKFRGDASLLAPAPALIEERTGVPMLGVVPWTRLDLPEEDSVVVREADDAPATVIACVRLPRVSNFDDLDPLAVEPGVAVRWIEAAGELEGADIIVLPGTRNTTGDLRWLWESGIAAAVRARARLGVPVVGLCGGFQMLGRTVGDPLGIEGGGSAPGLGLLDMETELAAEKTTRLARGVWTGAGGALGTLAGRPAEGYEIHHGETRIEPGSEVVVEVDGRPVGAGRDGVWGTYLHGCFDDPEVRAALLRSAGAGSGAPGERWEARIDRELDRWADVLGGCLDTTAIDRMIDLDTRAVATPCPR